MPRVDERLVGVDAGARPVELVHLLRDQVQVLRADVAAVEEAVLEAADDLGLTASRLRSRHVDERVAAARVLCRARRARVGR